MAYNQAKKKASSMWNILKPGEQREVQNALVEAYQTDLVVNQIKIWQQLAENNPTVRQELRKLFEIIMKDEEQHG